MRSGFVCCETGHGKYPWNLTFGLTGGLLTCTTGAVCAPFSLRSRISRVALQTPMNFSLTPVVQAIMYRDLEVSNWSAHTFKLPSLACILMFCLTPRGSKNHALRGFFINCFVALFLLPPMIGSFYCYQGWGIVFVYHLLFPFPIMDRVWRDL